MTDTLKPFWRYYGGKFRAAPRYPQPLHNTIVEPFAGAAGYSLRHYHRNIILIEKYAVVAEIWRYLIGVHSAEILAIPLVEDVDDLPAWVPQGGRWLVGFAMNAAVAQPCKKLSSGRKQLRAMGRVFEGWSEQMRARVALQCELIKHWKIFELGYENTGTFNPEATWFIDPPYQKAGIYYKHSSKQIDYARLALWCRERRGQVIVCENEGADWLPFEPFHAIKSSHMRTSGMARGTGYSQEVIWKAGAA